MEVFDGQQVFDPGLHPVLCRSALTLWTMPVPARVIGDMLMIAFGAGSHMPAKRSGAAILDG